MNLLLPAPADLPAQPDLPDPLRFFDGRRVTNLEQWYNERRPELKTLFQHYMYGFLPTERRESVVEDEDRSIFGGKAVLRQIALASSSADARPIHLLLIIPAARPRPAPVFLGLSFCGNHAVIADRHVRLSDAWMYAHEPGVIDNRATEAARGSQTDVWNVEETIDRGYAFAAFYSGDVAPDVSEGQTDRGIIAAWASGFSRAIDYLETDADIDAQRIAVVGHSRNGKAAMLAGAFDERIALTIAHQAGCGGTAPSRGTVGESVARINTVFPHWFNATFKQFNDCPDRLPFDQHSLLALAAPRPVLLSNAADDEWANPVGQFTDLQAADRVCRFLGAEGLEADQMPTPGTLINSHLGYYYRTGGHAMNHDDWQAFRAFADRHLGPPS